VCDGSTDHYIESTYDALALLDQIRRELRIEEGTRQDRKAEEGFLAALAHEEPNEREE
jgi:hypothetical protein